MDKSKKKLLNGAIIYFIGNVLAQLMSLALLRFITGRISPEEYGFYNLIVTISKIVTPFVTLQITDAIFRFLIRSNTDDEKKEYFTVACIIAFISSIITLVGVYSIKLFFLDIPHPFLITLYFISSTLYVLYQRIVRSFGKNTVYVKGNLIKTALYLILQIVFIYFFNLGVETLFLSTIISEMFFLIFAEIKIRALKLMDFKLLKFNVFKKMIKYSVPLIPSAAFWWLTSSVNTLIVSMRCGLDINGIYTVANKFSSVLTMVMTVFMMSWQETAISEYGKGQFKSFFTQTFNMYFKFVFSAIMVLVPFMAVVFPYMIDESYHASITYAPFLLVVAGLSTLAAFFSQIFAAQGRTTRSLFTNIAGMVINLTVVFLLVNKIGLWAAVLGSLASELVMVLLRGILVREEFQSGIEFGRLVLTFFLMVVSICLYFKGTIVYNIVWLVAAAIFALYMNFDLIKNTFYIFTEHIKKINSDI